MLSDIGPGNHNVKVYRKNSRYRRNRSTHWVYDGNVYVKQDFHVDITINRFGKAFVDERPLTGNYYDPYSYNNIVPMNQASFEQLKKTLTNQSYENTRMSIAKQAISQNYFTSQQVIELLETFIYESTKLDIAKFCYRYTVDKNNYYIVNDAFIYNSSKEELARFIQSAQ